MIGEALGISWTETWLTVVVAVGVYAAMILSSRVFGQRQLSQSSSYDLAFVFAMGSLMGRVILVRTSLLNAVVGLATMFALHAATGWAHHHVGAIHRLIQNAPVLLFARGELLRDNIERARTSAAEVYQQMRLSGVGSSDQVIAVVLERNGEFSVIKQGEHLDEEIFREVAGREHLVGAA